MSDFLELHSSGHFVIPNAWDVGSAKILQTLGFKAIATTSSGHAASLGKNDQEVRLDELLLHVEALVGAVRIPVSVDAEFGFSDSVEGLAETTRSIAAAGAAGMSIEDYSPDRGVLSKEEAVDRVSAVVDAAPEMVITARCENHLYGVDDLIDTVDRLEAYADAGAHVLYAPFLKQSDEFRAVVGLGQPVNALLLKGGLTVAELANLGVRRMSTGGALAFAAYGALEDAARELLEQGTSDYSARTVSSDTSDRAFGG